MAQKSVDEIVQERVAAGEEQLRQEMRARIEAQVASEMELEDAIAKAEAERDRRTAELKDFEQKIVYAREQFEPFRVKYFEMAAQLQRAGEAFEEAKDAFRYAEVHLAEVKRAAKDQPKSSESIDDVPSEVMAFGQELSDEDRLRYGRPRSAEETAWSNAQRPRRIA